MSRQFRTAAGGTIVAANRADAADPGPRILTGDEAEQARLDADASAERCAKRYGLPAGAFRTDAGRSDVEDAHREMVARNRNEPAPRTDADRVDGKADVARAHAEMVARNRGDASNK